MANVLWGQPTGEEGEKSEREKKTNSMITFHKQLSPCVCVRNMRVLIVSKRTLLSSSWWKYCPENVSHSFENFPFIYHNLPSDRHSFASTRSRQRVVTPGHEKEIYIITWVSRCMLKRDNRERERRDNLANHNDNEFSFMLNVRSFHALRLFKFDAFAVARTHL